MKQYQKNVLIFIVALAVVIGALFLIRTLRDQAVDRSMQGDALAGGLLENTVHVDGVDYLIPPSAIYDVGIPASDIPPINEPKFVNVGVADQSLADDVFGIAVNVGGQNRFYSYQVLNWHQVVNDSTGDRKFAVTHSVLTRSALVFNRVVDGRELTFRHSGKVYNNNTLLIDDQTGSLWLQGKGIAVAGELVGKKLERLPAISMTWLEWKTLYPAGVALATDTGFDRDYVRHPYTNYDTAKLIYFPINHKDASVPDKWLVNGIFSDTDAIAFVREIEKGFGVRNAEFDEKPVVGIYDFGGNIIRVFSSEVNGSTLTFKYDFNTKEITDDQTGSVWSIFGVAMRGELAGTQLNEIPTYEFLWFGWAALNPQTRVAHLQE